MSEFSSNDTGVDIQKLKGQVNYTLWKRDFQILAEVKEVWKLIIGKEPIVDKSIYKNYFILNKPNAATRSAAKSAEERDKNNQGVSNKPNIITRSAAKKVEERKEDNYKGKKSYFFFQLKVAEYKIDLEEFKKNSKLVRFAK